MLARDAGHSDIVFLPFESMSQKLASSSTPCGNLKEKPITAIGSMVMILVGRRRQVM